MDAKAEPQAGVADVVYDRLRADILGGALQLGKKLKLEGLRGRYDVSINTLRETLSRLSAVGGAGGPRVGIAACGRLSQALQGRRAGGEGAGQERGLAGDLQSRIPHCA